MLPIKLTLEAKSDLKDILKYTENVWGESQRKIYKSYLDKTLALIAEFPQGGLRRDELFIGCRSKRVEQHTIFYQIMPKYVQIVRILHIRMELTSRLENF